LTSTSLGVQYRDITTTKDLEQIPVLERQVWGLKEVDCIPPTLLTSLVHIGGSIHGAFVGETLVGVSLGVPTADRKTLWSYMTAVHAEYQSLGIGLKLKLEQHQWATKRHYATISWTFDPLQARNVNFNFNVLRVIAKTYHVDFYGPMPDTLNEGLPSDRLEVVWNLKDISVSSPVRESSNSVAKALLEMRTSTGDPVFNKEHLVYGDSLLAVQIPPDINSIRLTSPTIAMKWRLALRECLTACLSNSYRIIGFERTDIQSSYILEKTINWYVYLVRCADGTLYTGISNNPIRRIKQHNAGKGAAYTASRRPVVFEGAWLFADRGAATRAESHLKRLRRVEKERLVECHLPFDGAMFIEAL